MSLKQEEYYKDLMYDYFYSLLSAEEEEYYDNHFQGCLDEQLIVESMFEDSDGELFCNVQITGAELYEKLIEHMEDEEDIFFDDFDYIGNNAY
jgi:hypothetical protein